MWIRPKCSCAVSSQFTTATNDEVQYTRNGVSPNLVNIEEAAHVQKLNSELRCLFEGVLTDT